MSKTVAVKLTPKGERSIRNGHPWVFSNSIDRISDNATTGDLAIIFSRSKNSLIAIGIYDADSPIRIKVIYHGSKSITINTKFFEKQIAKAYDRRLKLLQTDTTAYRLLFGENDGFPGLIADVYNTVLVVKLYSNIWISFIDRLLKILQETSKAEAVVIRLGRKLQHKNIYDYQDGQIVFGLLESEVIAFKEYGVNFAANVIKGHKTGYFLDHRHNRRNVGKLSKNKSVLDVFSYSGGFSTHALANGAKSVTSVDISRQALDMAKSNAELNTFNGKHNTIVGDAFNIMERLIAQKKAYDIVIIDPPSFAKEQSKIDLAKKKYAQLAVLGARLTAKKGLLVLASCSSRVKAQSFFDLNDRVLKSLSRPFRTVQKTLHDSDHPITFPEAAYLKTGYYRFIDF